MLVANRKPLTDANGLQPVHLRMTEDQRTLWKARHFGQLAEIASELKFSKAYTGQVFAGERRNDAISARLDEAILASLAGGAAVAPAEQILDAPATRKAPGRTNYSRTGQSSTVFAQAGRQG